MKNATWTAIVTGKDEKASGLEYFVDGEYVYVRTRLDGPTRVSASGNSLVLAATGGTKIENIGPNGGYFRGCFGFSMGEREKKRAKIAKLQAELAADAK